jgi:hypothetical protein
VAPGPSSSRPLLSAIRLQLVPLLPCTTTADVLEHVVALLPDEHAVTRHGVVAGLQQAAAEKAVVHFGRLLLAAAPEVVFPPLLQFVGVPIPL